MIKYDQFQNLSLLIDCSRALDSRYQTPPPLLVDLVIVGQANNSYSIILQHLLVQNQIDLGQRPINCCRLVIGPTYTYQLVTRFVVFATYSWKFPKISLLFYFYMTYRSRLGLFSLTLYTTLTARSTTYNRYIDCLFKLKLLGLRSILLSRSSQIRSNLDQISN